MPDSEKGRPAQAPGVGAGSKRHDLETRAVPFYHDSDLQQGDVQAYEQGRKITQPRTQAPAAPRGRTGGRRGGVAAPNEIPDPIDFIAGRAQNTYMPDLPNPQQKGIDPRPWMGMLQELALSPGSGGVLGATYVEMVRRQEAASHIPEVGFLDLQEGDNMIEAWLSDARTPRT